MVVLAQAYDRKKLRVSVAVLVGVLAGPLLVYAAVNSLNSQTGATQTFSNDTNVTVTSTGDVHSLGWSGVLSVLRGGTGQSSFTKGSVLFAGPQKIKEDNVNFYWDNVGKILFVPAVHSSVSLSFESGTSWPVNITGGGGAETGNGGPINLTAGDGGAMSGDGGPVEIRAGDSGADPAVGDGGAILIATGTASDDGDGGALSLIAGDGGKIFGDAGVVLMKAGSTGGAGVAGSVTIMSGSAAGSGRDSGDVHIVGADHDPNNPGVGGDVKVVAGAAGEASDGGAVEILAGSGGSLVGGDGGGIRISAGNALLGNSNGGNIMFRAGAGSGAGIQGEYRFAKSTSSHFGALNFEALTANRAFVFPNYSGTLGLLETDQVFTGFNKFEATTSSSIQVGSSAKTGCIVMGDSDGVGVTYVTANDGVLTASTVKPGICQ